VVAGSVLEGKGAVGVRYRGLTGQQGQQLVRSAVREECSSSRVSQVQHPGESEAAAGAQG